MPTQMRLTNFGIGGRVRYIGDTSLLTGCEFLGIPDSMHDGNDPCHTGECPGHVMGECCFTYSSTRLNLNYNRDLFIILSPDVAVRDV
jgi:hypothetical protein